MKISYINQLITKLYENTDINDEPLENLQNKDDITSTILNLKDLSIDETVLDTVDNTPAIAATLNIKHTKANLAYIQRLGFSIGINLEKLSSLIDEDKRETICEQLKKFAISPEEIRALLQDMTIEDLLYISDALDKMVAIIRYHNGEYINITTRLSAGIDNEVSMEYNMQQILDILQELDMSVTPENVEIIDKFIFVFEEKSLELVQILKNVNESGTTIDIKDIIQEPKAFLEFNRIIHNLTHTVDNSNIQYIHHRTNDIISYIKLFPTEIRKNIYKLFEKELSNLQYIDLLFPEVDMDFKKELMTLFESKLKYIEDDSIVSELYSLIEADIAEVLNIQIEDNFPFWLIPIFTVYDNKLLFGELWISKKYPRHQGKSLPYNLFLWSDFPHLGRIELFIHGIDKNINIYILSSDTTVDLIKKHNENITQILKSHGFTVKYINYSKLKDRNSIYRYIFTTSVARDELDIRI